MAKLLGKEYSKTELLKYAGNIKQIAGISNARLTDGKSDGIKSMRVKTGGGLEYDLLPSKCMDIGSLSYKGINMSYIPKTGITAPEYAYPYELEFLHYISGGMMFTCGLLNTGDPNRDDDGTYYPLHGRIANIPANNPYSRCYWQDDDYILEAGGEMVESKMFAHNLSLTRKITSKLGCNEINLTDVLENNDTEEKEFLLLYHTNFAFPFIDENVRLILPENTVKPRTEIARTGLNESEVITKPQDGFFEHVFLRDVKADSNGLVTVKVENSRLGIGAYIIFEKANFPILSEWKSMRSGDYVLGFEPTNTFLRGRKEEHKAGVINKIAPFSKITFNYTIGFYDI